jgi:DNA-binding response OmpR family regulator
VTIKLLLADDEPNQLELLVATFSNPDFSVIRARDGRQAIDMAEENLPDLIILDWMMPNISVEKKPS